MRVAIAQLRLWPARRWLVALGGAILSAVITGGPTDLIDTPLFGRTIGITVWAYPVWILAAILAGLLVATELRPGRPIAGGGFMALFAVGCPVCNKPAVLLLGSGGAVTWFGPLQPLVGALAIGLLGVALVLRLRLQATCPVPAAALSGSPAIESGPWS